MSQNSARGRDPLGKETRSVNRENFIKSLDKNVKKYDNFLKKYASSSIRASGSTQIINIIKERYF